MAQSPQTPPVDATKASITSTSPAAADNGEPAQPAAAEQAPLKVPSPASDDSLSPEFLNLAQQLVEGKAEPKGADGKYLVTRLQIALSQQEQSAQRLQGLQGQIAQAKSQLDINQGQVNTWLLMLKRSEG